MLTSKTSAPILLRQQSDSFSTLSTQPQLWNEERYAPYKIAALVEVLNEQGISPKVSLSGTNLTPESLTRPNTLTSIRHYITVCRNALRLSSDPETPFRVGSRMHLSAYGLYGFALLCSPTIRDFFQLAIKYHQLATPVVSVSWREDLDRLSWLFPMSSVLASSDPLVRFLLEQQLTQHVIQMRDLVGQQGCAPLRATLHYAAPSHSHLYERYLGCEVRFNQPVSQLSYSRSLLSKRPQMAHGLTSKLLQETCDKILREAKRPISVSNEVYQIIASTPGHCPSMESVAERLATTVRTLHRRLQAEGASFTEILDNVRCTLAKEHLRTTELSTEDISALLGYSDAANFRHAFRRWTGSTPARYRRRNYWTTLTRETTPMCSETAGIFQIRCAEPAIG